jgi:anti-sigma regulatory factor (Ser/Thr protein kinase)
VSIGLDEWIAAEPEALRALRQRVRKALRRLQLPDQDADMVLLVLDELVSNAIEHGASYRRRPKPLHVRLHAQGIDLVFEFDDLDMPAPQVAAMAKALGDGDVELPDFEDERGRGLFLIATAMQAIVVEDRSAQGDGMRLTGRFVGVARS